MNAADNDNGPNPCASLAPAFRVGLAITRLVGERTKFAVMTHRYRDPTRGMEIALDAMLPHPVPAAFGWREGPPAPAPSPAQGTTRKVRPAFIRGVIEKTA